MKQFETLASWRAHRRAIAPEQSIGFVPTMGNLHEGHASLVQRAVEENDIVVVSIFVNPTQFNDKNDLKHYPRTLVDDLSLLLSLNVDAVLLPRSEALYPDDYRYQINETELSLSMEGADRPGHFNGMLSVVMKLLNIVQPRRAYFGEKDFQQYQLIKAMCEAFFMPCDIIPCPIVRAEDGLALSSRNQHLSAEARQKAPLLYETIKNADSAESAIQTLQTYGFSVGYVNDQGGRRYVAATLDGVRLIDNLQLVSGLSHQST